MLVALVAALGCGSDDDTGAQAGAGAGAGGALAGQVASGSGGAGGVAGSGGTAGGPAPTPDAGAADAITADAATPDASTAAPAHQDDTTLEQLSLVGEETLTENFGNSVALDGHTLVVSGTDGGVVLGSGAAYVFVRDGAGWSLQQKLLAPDPQRYDLFGSPVAVSGDTILIAGNGTAQGGNVFVFVRSGTTWSLEQELAASDDAVDMRFGSALALEDDTAVIGASHMDASAPGAAYVFVRDAGVWTEQARLEGSREYVNHFGRSVAISGNTVLVGAGSRVTTAAAYVFEPSGTAAWNETAQLIASEPVDFAVFGGSVALSGDTAVVGASGEDVDTGSVYVFERSGADWSESQKLRGSDSVLRDEFGGAVRIDADTIVIGARYHDDGGAAYVFTRSAGEWTQKHELRSSDAGTSDAFGTALAVSGTTVVVGALTHNGREAASGAAYVYEL